jgi:purine-binding chemotaxis protein CheW
METTQQATQYLTCTLDQEIFAVDVGRVKEILECTAITKIPRTPDFMRGVINLRGSVVPVIDLRLKFGLPPAEQTIDTCIIVVEVLVEDEVITIGALADSVQEVIEMEPGQIEAAPRIGTHIDTDLIRGMGKHNNSFVMVLDVDHIFSDDTLAAIRAEE